MNRVALEEQFVEIVRREDVTRSNFARVGYEE